MVNILFVSYWLNKNGTEEFMMNILRNIDKNEYHVDFLIFSDEITYNSREAERLGSTIYRLPPRKKFFKYYRELNRFFNKYGYLYSAIHYCEGNLSSIAPIYYAHKYRIPVRIIHSHNSGCEGIHNKILHRFNRKFGLKYGTQYFACSSLAAKWFFLEKPAVIIKNGINVNVLSYDKERREKLREILNIGRDTHVIGHVGRFVSVKNHDFIIDVFSKYISIYEDSLLFLAGIGPLQEKIRDKVHSLKIDEKVIFLGERYDIPDWMQVFDCLLMPSFFEGLPFVLVEAQTAGLPCVISDTINKDIIITPNVRFHSLDESPITWATEIEDTICNIKRAKTDHLIVEAGYSIKSTVKYLELIYSQKGVFI